MNKLRLKRFRNVGVDMAPLCDVAFLILCFLIATARFKQWEPMKINVPEYTNRISDPADDDIAIISIAGDKVMLQIVESQVRQQTLLQMARKYHLSFSGDEQARFFNASIIGAPISQLNQQYDDQYTNWAINANSPGIPYSLDDNQLFDWIYQSRLAEETISNRSLRFMVKADKNVQYPILKRVIDILQSQKINKFQLLTHAKHDHP